MAVERKGESKGQFTLRHFSIVIIIESVFHVTKNFQHVQFHDCEFRNSPGQK